MPLVFRVEKVSRKSKLAIRIGLYADLYTGDIAL